MVHVGQDVFTSFGCEAYRLGLETSRELYANMETIQSGVLASDVLFPMCQLEASLQKAVVVEGSNSESDSGTGPIRFTTRHILEGDAMMSVHEHFKRAVERDDEIARILEWDSALRWEMDNISSYQEIYTTVREWIRGLFGWDSEYFIEQHHVGRDKCSPTYLLLRFLTDYSLSVPYPAAATPAESVPAVRFGEAIAALTRMSVNDYKLLCRLIASHHDRAFALLDSLCAHASDSWDEVDKWLAWLKDIYAKTTDPIAWVRIQALEYKRADYFRYMMNRNLDMLLNAGIPLFYRKDDGIHRILPCESPFSEASYIARIGSFYAQTAPILAVVQKARIVETAKLEGTRDSFDVAITSELQSFLTDNCKPWKLSDLP